MAIFGALNPLGFFSRRFAARGLLLWLALFACLALSESAYAQIAYRSGNTTATATNPTSVVMTKPAGTVQGDVMIAAIGQRGDNGSIASTVPAGWTKLGFLKDSVSMGFEYYYKVAGAAEPANYTFPFGNTGATDSVIMSFSGVDNASPIVASGSKINLGTSANQAPTLTATASGQWYVGLYGSNAGAAMTAQASMTTRLSTSTNNGNGANSIGILAATESLGASGATGVRTATQGASNNGLAAGIILRSASAGLLQSFAASFNTATAGSCAPPTFTLTAKLANGSTYAGYTGTVTLSTSTAHGTWAKLSANGTLAAGADTGSATYTFVAADNGVATFTLGNTHAESLTATAVDGLIAATSGSTAFSDNVFVVAPSDALGYEVIAGRPHAFTATYYQKNATTGVCGVVSGYTGAKPLDFWYSATANHPAGATAPSVSAAATSSACTSPSTLPASAPATSAASNTLSLAFAAGKATFYLCTSDVGQYAINLRDDTLSYSASVVSGVSSTATARPFALVLGSIASGATPNPGGTASSGSKFATAESTFTATATAKLWAFGQDTATPGTPDAGANLSGNAAAARFSAPTTVAISSKTPASSPGVLSGGSILASSFASGSASASLSYNDVGSVVLSASSPAYLGSPYAVPGQASGAIGRFYPATLALSAATAAPACSASSLTYMDQPFALGATLTALGSNGGTLASYDSASGYAYLATPAWAAVNAANGINLASRLSTGTAPTWISGVWTYANNASFSRAASPDGPYDAMQIGISAADADLAALAPYDMSKTAAGACTTACNAAAVGSATKMRHGRLEIANATGTVLDSLRTAVSALYWNAPLGWAPNTLDHCTAIPYASFSKSTTGALTGIALPSGTMTLSSGTGTLVATKTPTGSGISGSATIGLNLGSTAASPSSCASGLPSAPAANLPHLQSNFCSSSSYGKNPNAKLIWGAPNSKSGSSIFLREMY